MNSDLLSPWLLSKQALSELEPRLIVNGAVLASDQELS